MAALNRVFIIGHLGADPEVRELGSGQTVTRFPVAINERWTDREGVLQKRTTWVRVEAWGGLADVCRRYLSKGRSVFVAGRIRQDYTEDDEGRRRYFPVTVVADNVQFLDRPPEPPEEET